MPSAAPPDLSLGALILAAGKGTRMYSDKPKVLQTLLEEPMLRYVRNAAISLCPQTTWTIIGHAADCIRKSFPLEERFILQEPQRGTGHALRTAMPFLLQAGLSHILVVNGDTPLIRPKILRAFLDVCLAEDADLAFISLTPDDPAAYGRVVRSESMVAAIVEAGDYDETLHGPMPGEINAGIYYLRLAAVGPLLSSLTDGNSGREFYLTDLVHLAVFARLNVLGHNLGNVPELLGINTPRELLRSEEMLRESIINRHLDAGALIRSPGAVRIGPDVLVEAGASICGPTEIYGRAIIRRGAHIASHCRLTDSVVGEGAAVHSFSFLQEAEVGPSCVVGPYARLRPGAVLEEKAHVGNFVEVKNSRLGKGVKANHLAYLGDSDIGDGANIGAGAITCNYDGRHKYRTVIGPGAFIGSNSSLVAPVSIGEGSAVGAGSVIIKEVPDASLAIARGRQRNIPRNGKIGGPSGRR
ncbi:MAG: bifunctional UDP-N-acetylglucosamine diphosphorylase/glucosamine-1-phosphate N-acetyltransferase GlmU [Desulfovibrio sp.]|jgi:bifunctional UDP-N-acetylglucosamine pyrophosphorylase/glucosamine-1-phosphate N-acetyltransferase|nr:bifunctional UDP-N-acetylglucosamine diphosphorylase/glucosamine-1-phosphate N-acetyltransferase GlmU [Desulfovibrio sp.]